MHLANRRWFVTGLMLVGLLAVGRSALAGESAGLPNPFYAYCVGIGTDQESATLEAQLKLAPMLAELGYAGMAHVGLKGTEEMLEALEEDDEQEPWRESLPDALRDAEEDASDDWPGDDERHPLLAARAARAQLHLASRARPRVIGIACCAIAARILLHSGMLLPEADLVVSMWQGRQDPQSTALWLAGAQPVRNHRALLHEPIPRSGHPSTAGAPRQSPRLADSHSDCAADPPPCPAICASARPAARSPMSTSR